MFKFSLLPLACGLVLALAPGSLSAQQNQQQQPQQSSSGGLVRTFIVSRNQDGAMRVETNGRQLEGQTGTGSDGQELESEREEEDADEELVVAGLLEWLKEKKRRKKEKKEEKKRNKNKRPTDAPVQPPQPVQPFEPQPQPPEGPKKEIHIHIHIKTKDQDKKHKKHGGHYEDYHDGHYEHDKHFNGKHSFPLLGHHHNFGQSGAGSWDHSAGDFFGGGGSGDEYGGYESKKLDSYTIEKRPVVVQRPVLVKKEN